MRRKLQENRQIFASYSDDADAAAGITIPSAPTPMSTTATSASDIEFFEGLVSDPVLILGVDISHLSRTSQFLLCASGVFTFSLAYGYLQELLSVQLCSRQLGLFLATFQFTGYTTFSFLLRTFVYKAVNRKKMTPKSSNISSLSSALEVPLKLYVGLSLLRAVDLAMTNMAMQYINYPAKTLMKSSRVVFTMIFGVLITKKSYKFMDYFVVLCMVAGLAIFMHADANSSAVFQPIGVIMLTISLLCDAVITNMSESIMRKFGVGQDEFIFRMYSIALVAIAVAATVKGDLRDGIIFIFSPGTYAEQQENVPIEDRSWTVASKMWTMILFSIMGFFGSSCSAAITKNFGALAMSITSTARKATTLFLSFWLFNNHCTAEHIVGIVIFISALTTKSLRRKHKKRMTVSTTSKQRLKDLEAGPSISSLESAESILRSSGGRSRRRTRTRESESPKLRYHIV